MFNRTGLVVLSILFASVLFVSRADAQYTLSTAPWSTLGFTDFKTLEALDTTPTDANYGNPSYIVTGPVMFEGIVLNNPAAMTNSQAGNPALGGPGAAQPPTSIPYNPDPYWQVFVQTNNVNSDGDFGGAAVYAGQNYGNLPGSGLTFPGGVATPDPTQSYSAEAWYQDVQRISNGVANNVNSQPAVVGAPIVAGDLVIVEALGGLAFDGKEILNEEHEISPYTQFQFVNLGYVGLPTATPITLAQLYNNTSSVYFDPTRQIGAEHYESTLVQLDDVMLMPGQASSWLANGLVTVEDSSGREFPLELGTNADFVPANAPTGFFDVTGIFDKETGSATTSTFDPEGYDVWVMDPTTVSPVPETSSFALVFCGSVVMLGAAWRRRLSR